MMAINLGAACLSAFVRSCLAAWIAVNVAEERPGRPGF